MDILAQLNDAVVTESIDELLLGIDGDDTINGLSHLRSRLGILVTHTVVIILSLFTLQQLDVGCLDDIELDAVVAGNGLIPSTGTSTRDGPGSRYASIAAGP